MKLLNKLDSAKIYMAGGQITFMTLGYLTQVLLSKVILDSATFSGFQFINFFTNILNLFFATAIPSLMLSSIPQIKDKAKKVSMLKIHATKMIRLVSGQMIIIFVATTILFILGLINLNIYLYIILSCIQVFAFGLMNITSVFFIALKQYFKFTRNYTFYILLKSLLTIIAAIIFKDPFAILLFIIIAELVQFSINSYILKVNPLRFSKVEYQKSESSIQKSTWDFIASNLLIFGVTNLSVALPYLGLSSNYNEYSIFTLIFPWSLFSFYIISAIGNVYIVDFATGKTKSAISALKSVFVFSVILSIISLILGSTFFFIFYRESLSYAVSFLLLSLPSGIIICQISTVISIYQGLHRLKELRVFIVGLISIYSIIILFTKDLKNIIVFSTVAYLCSYFYIIFIQSRVKKSN